jgi:ADP-ribosyl-[dinitrogen reductase] hydrolase
VSTSRPVKTSLTHPLQIYAVKAAAGAIGMAMCPGKVQPRAATGPWDRDLDIDMDAVAAFGATIMITLMEMHELDAAVPAARLRAAAQVRGITWLHLPIVDLAVPDAAFEQAWLSTGKAVRAALRNGAKVFVHCRGGRGRSGLLAARLLIELGAAPADAIKAVRTSNPLAIETAVQEEHVKACEAVAE